MNLKEQEYSNIILELYTTKKWAFSDKWLALTVPEINDILGKTLFILMDSKINVDMDEYSKLAIYIKSHLPPSF